MGKIGIAKIEGPSNPEIGQAVTYTITKWYDDTPADKRKPENITWELFKKDISGKYISTTPRRMKKGGSEYHFTFGEIALGEEYMLEAYLIAPEKKQPPAILITPKAGKPELITIDLLDSNYKKVATPMQYGQTLIAQVHSANVKDNEKIKITLSEEGKTNTDAPQEATVKRGVAEANFFLKPDLAALANAHTNGTTHKTYEVKATYNQKVYSSTKITVESLEQKQSEGKNVIEEIVKTAITALKVGLSIGTDPVTTPSNKPVVVNMPEKINDTSSDDKCPRCKGITKNQAGKIFSAAKDKLIDDLVEAFNRKVEINIYDNKGSKTGTKQEYIYNIFQVNTCLRKAHFFAQVIPEIGEGMSDGLDGESMNYSVNRLRSGAPFGCFKNNPTLYEEAGKIGRIDGFDKHGKKIVIQTADQKAIANIAYADNNRSKNYKLGNTQEGDGWKFRGRGFIQTTGRESYGKIQVIIDRFLSNSGINIADGNERPLTVFEALIMGLADWYNLGCYTIADTGCNSSAVTAIVKKINFSTDSYNKRIAYLLGGTHNEVTTNNNKPYTVPEEKSMKEIFQVEDCTILSPKTDKSQNKNS